MKWLWLSIGIIALIIFMIYRAQEKEIITPPSVLVQLAPVTQKSMSKHLTAYGMVNFDPEYIQQLTVQNEVFIQRVFVNAGQRVKKGAALLEILPTASAKLNLSNAKIEAEFAQKELKRQMDLRKQYLATNADVQAAKQNADKTEAALNKLGGQQQAESSQTLHADADITISTVNIQPGQVISASMPLLSFGDHKHIQVRLGIENGDISQVHVGQQVVISPLTSNKLSWTGKIDEIADQIEASTGLINVSVPLDKATALIPGSMVQGDIYLETRNALAVPRSAVLYQDNKPYVFVAVKDKAQQRWVTVWEDDGQSVAILTGLKKDEKVVIVGNYELENGMLLRIGKP